MTLTERGHGGLTASISVEQSPRLLGKLVFAPSNPKSEAVETPILPRGQPPAQAASAGATLALSPMGTLGYPHVRASAA